MKRAISFFLSFAVALLLGCSSPSGKESAQDSSKQPAANQFETGRIALQKMIPPARFWAPDAKPVRMESEVMKDNNGQDGKSAFWRATFASPSTEKAETFTWSGMSNSDTPRGVDHGAADSFNPSNRSTQPFELGFLKVDSDKAFEVAQQHGGKQLLAKDPTAGVKYALEWDPQAGQLKWRVAYGGTDVSPRLTVIVNASTGDFVHKE
jgi:hypothetical protein